MTTTAAEQPAARGRRPGSIVLLVLGSTLGLVAFALLAAGAAALWADRTQRDADGYPPGSRLRPAHAGRVPAVPTGEVTGCQLQTA